MRLSTALIVQLALTTASYAMPEIQARTAGVTIVSNFDDLPSNPIIVNDAQAIKKPYDGLIFNILQARQDGASILRSRSKNNTAASNQLNRQLQGQPPPNITTVYPPGLRTKYYDLISTYIGCAVTSEASAGAPQACDLRFTATKKVGGQTFEKICKYRPKLLSNGQIIDASLALCEFTGNNNFKGLETVKVEVARSLTVPTSTVLYLDDFKHVNYP